MVDSILQINDFNIIFQNMVISLLGFATQQVAFDSWVSGGAHGRPPFNPYYFVISF